jgi:hypothetical protein
MDKVRKPSNSVGYTPSSERSELCRLYLINNIELSSVWVSIDRVGIGDSIYWPFIHTHDSWLHFTDHWHIETSVLSALKSPLVVSWQRILTQELYNSLTELHIPDITHKVFSSPWDYQLSTLAIN